MYPKPRFQFAADRKIKRLFHYQRFKPGNKVDRERLEDILVNHRIYCSNPLDFNDPWDCKPYFDPNIFRDPTKRKLLTEVWKTTSPRIRAKRFRNQAQFEKEFNQIYSDFIKGYSDSFSRIFVPRNYRVYCLAKSGTHPLMWSHYADSHRGVCLEFSALGSKFQYAWQVQYQRRYPRFDFTDIEHGLWVLLSKSDVWKYEGEFRLICPIGGVKPDKPLSLTDDKYLKYDPRALISITVGCQGDFAKISSFIKKRAPSVNVRRAVRSPVRYSLQIR